MEERVIRYRAVECAIGWLLVAATERGICNVRFGDDPVSLVRELAAEFPFAAIRVDEEGLGEWSQQLLRIVRGEAPTTPLPLDVRGSQFQRRVWSAIQAIPRGATRSYAELADSLGQRRGARAVAGACASNPVALLVPCHRVVGSGGRLGGYRYGAGRKRALLHAEGSRVAAESPLRPGPWAGCRPPTEDAPLRASRPPRSRSSIPPRCG